LGLIKGNFTGEEIASNEFFITMVLLCVSLCSLTQGMNRKTNKEHKIAEWLILIGTTMVKNPP